MNSEHVPAKLEAGIWIYLWDLIDESIEETLDALAARGVDRLHVAALYHSARCLLPHNPRRTVIDVEGGTAYYRPRGEYGRLRPLASEFVGADDPLALVIEGAHRRGMKVSAWMTPGHDFPLATVDRGCATVNAFGDVNPAILCPANADVREYAANCLADLLDHYAFDGIQIETMDFWGFVHDAHHEKIGVALCPRAEWLLSLCFCPACIGNATSLDPVAFRGVVVRALKRYFECGDEKVLEEVASGDLSAYQEQRCSTVADAVGTLRQQTSQHKVPLEYIVAPDLDWMRHAGIDVIRLANTIDGLAVMAYRETTAEVASALETMARFACAKDATICLQACHPYLRRREQASELIETCIRMGFRKVSFYNYGLASTRALGWIGDAITTAKTARRAEAGITNA